MRVFLLVAALLISAQAFAVPDELPTTSSSENDVAPSTGDCIMAEVSPEESVSLQDLQMDVFIPDGDYPWTKVAKQIALRLNERAPLKAAGDLDEVARQMTESFGFYVYIDLDALAQVGVKATEIHLDVDTDELPIRSILREMLFPHRLQCQVRSDGLAIIPDFAQWIDNGLPAERWVDPAPEIVLPILEALEKKVSFEFNETPLSDVASRFASELRIPVRINELELASIGLSLNDTASGSVNDMKAWEALDYFLRDLDCVTTIQHEGLEITTNDAIDTESMLRVYFLEGTGFHRSNLSPAISLIQLMIEPDSWAVTTIPFEIVTVKPSMTHRPALMISGGLTRHRKIKRLFDGLRAIAVGPDEGSEPDFGIVP